MTGVIWAVLIFSLAQTVLLDSNDNKNITEAKPTKNTMVKEATPTENTMVKGTLTSYTAMENGTPTSCNTTGNETKSWWDKYLTLEHGIPFAAGAGLSAIVCSACCCVIGLCSRRKRRKRRDEDKEYPGAALTMVASVDRQRSGSAGLAEDEQAPLHAGEEATAAAAGEEGAAENSGAVQQECADAGEQG